MEPALAVARVLKLARANSSSCFVLIPLASRLRTWRKANSSAIAIATPIVKVIRVEFMPLAT